MGDTTKIACNTSQKNLTQFKYYKNGVSQKIWLRIWHHRNWQFDRKLREINFIYYLFAQYTYGYYAINSTSDHKEAFSNLLFNAKLCINKSYIVCSSWIIIAYSVFKLDFCLYYLSKLSHSIWYKAFTTPACLIKFMAKKSFNL